VSRLEQRLIDCEIADGEAKKNLEQRETELQARIEQLDAARSAVKTATDQRVQMSRVLELVKLSASYAVVAQRLTDATSAADKEAEARKIAAAIRVTAKDVERFGS
jgi:hypothetical protein